uniref:Uncharacterized protein n=1 Tax=Panagrellus redivivus TaxID=6233 RepID=A0A7E4ULW0_PANRE
MFLVRCLILTITLHVALGYEIYELPFESISKMAQNKREMNQPFEIMHRKLRDPGWRHIGLGKRSSQPVLSMSPERTWSMMGLGR